MSASLEARRRAVADALRRVAAEPSAASLTSIEQRLDELASRLSAVETALLEAAWDRPVVEPVTVAEPVLEPVEYTAAADAADEGAAGEDQGEDRVSVPAVSLAAGRMSSVAARALFGA